MIEVNYIYEKGISPVNEDNYYINKDTNTYAVFDGAGSLNGKNGGYKASQIALNSFTNNPKDNLLDQFIDINNTISIEMNNEKVDISLKENLWSTAACAVKINLDKNEVHYAQISDCLIMFLYKDKSYKIISPNYEHDQETLTLKSKLSPDDFKKQIIKVRRLSNIDYGLLNGEPGAVGFIYNGSETIEKITDILLFSDGLLIPNPNPLKPDDFKTLISLYCQNGLQEIKDYVRNLQVADPRLTKFPRFKIHDDITAISIKIR